MHLVPPTLYSKLMNLGNDIGTDLRSTDGKCLTINQLNSIENQDGAKVFISQKPENQTHMHHTSMSNNNPKSDQSSGPSSNIPNVNDQSLNITNQSKSKSNASFNLNNTIASNRNFEATLANDNIINQSMRNEDDPAVKENDATFTLNRKGKQGKITDFFASRLPEDEGFRQTYPPQSQPLVTDLPENIAEPEGINAAPNTSEHNMSVNMNRSYGNLNETDPAMIPLPNTSIDEFEPTNVSTPLIELPNEGFPEELQAPPAETTPTAGKSKGAFLLTKKKPTPILKKPKGRGRSKEEIVSPQDELNSIQKQHPSKKPRETEEIRKQAKPPIQKQKKLAPAVQKPSSKKLQLARDRIMNKYKADLDSIINDGAASVNTKLQQLKNIASSNVLDALPVQPTAQPLPDDDVVLGDAPPPRKGVKRGGVELKNETATKYLGKSPLKVKYVADKDVPAITDIIVPRPPPRPVPLPKTKRHRKDIVPVVEQRRQKLNTGDINPKHQYVETPTAAKKTSRTKKQEGGNLMYFKF